MPGRWALGRFILALAASFFLAGVSPAPADPATAKRLDRLADQFSSARDARQIRPKLSRQGNAAWLRKLGGYEKRLDRIDKGRLGSNSRMTRQLLSDALKTERSYLTQGWIREDLGAVSSLMLTPYLEANGFDHATKNINDWRSIIKTLEHSGSFVKGYVGLLKQGLAEGRAQPRAVVESSINVLGTLTSSESTANPFLQLEDSMARSLAGRPQWKGLHARLHHAVENITIPAHKELKAFLETSYLPQATEKIGVDRARYLHAMESHIGPGYQPEKLQAYGRAEVKRLQGELWKTALEIDPKTTSLSAFMRGLRARKSEHFSDPEALLQAARRATDAAAGFAHKMAPIPTNQLDIVPVPRAEEDTATAQYVFKDAKHNRGQFEINTGKLLGEHTQFGLATLATHEVFGGHHLAALYADRQKKLPAFRRDGNHTAYDEGWALYAEQWRDEQGGFTPLERVGFLKDQLWRAARLVVDTGLHTGTMTRQQAIDYFKRSTFEGHAAAAAEIERYINWPGQALAYYVGRDQFLATREKVKGILGQNYDERAFHAKILSLAPMPMEMVDRAMTEWAHRRQGQLAH